MSSRQRAWLRRFLGLPQSSDGAPGIHDRPRVSSKTDELIATAGRLLEALQGRRVSAEQLSPIIRDNPDASAALAFALLEQDGNDVPALQRAITIGAIFQQVHGDDSVFEYVRLSIERAGITDLGNLNVETPQERSGVEIVTLTFDRQSVIKGDISHIISTFENDDALREYKARCLLGFPYDSDPREIWDIPECRAYVSKIHSALPFFPYVLDGDPGFGSVFAYIVCLCPRDAFLPPNQLNLFDPDVVSVLVNIVSSVADKAKQLGDDPAGIVRDRFRIIPDPFLDQLLQSFPRNQ